MHAVDAKRHYAEQAATTVSPARLVLLAYESAAGAIEAAECQLKAEKGDLGVVSHELGRAQQLLAELEGALDHNKGGAMASSLQSLYAYARRRLLEANLAKDPVPLPEIRRIITDLGDAWRSAVIEGQTS